jgi:hypothetical protein
VEIINSNSFYHFFYVDMSKKKKLMEEPLVGRDGARKFYGRGPVKKKNSVLYNFFIKKNYFCYFFKQNDYL